MSKALKIEKLHISESEAKVGGGDTKSPTGLLKVPSRVLLASKYTSSRSRCIVHFLFMLLRKGLKR